MTHVAWTYMKLRMSASSEERYGDWCMAMHWYGCGNSQTKPAMCAKLQRCAGAFVVVGLCLMGFSAPVDASMAYADDGNSTNAADYSTANCAQTVSAGNDAATKLQNAVNGASVAGADPTVVCLAGNVQLDASIDVDGRHVVLRNADGNSTVTLTRSKASQDPVFNIKNGGSLVIESVAGGG